MHERFLSGKVAWVTGGASGMGRAMAMAFARAGARVAIGSLLQSPSKSDIRGELVYLPGEEELQTTRKELEAFDVPALAMNLDVTQPESVQACYDATIKSFGHIDILANAAGMTAEQTVCGHTEALWQRVMDVNCNGVFRTMRLCLPGMIDRKWGRIINIASTAAAVAASTSAAYCASKAAVVALSKAAALEGAPHGVTANSISPGWVNTNFGKHWMGHIADAGGTQTADAYIEETQAQNPQKRMIQPTEIGALAAFLCREEAMGITMQDLTVSAGSLW